MKRYLETWSGSFVEKKHCMAVIRGWKKRAVGAENLPNLGCATTGELLKELRARSIIDGSIKYRTVDSD